MAGMMAEEKVFKDPVHKYIYVQDQTIWDLINSREFQRLRRIRQLGTSYLTFHGAEHSRFSHSLGVYEITRRIISQFDRNGSAEWPREERLLCLCASLLHDVGHGPFSHSMEKVLHTNHEDWTRRIVLGDTDVHRILRLADPELPNKVASVIAKTYTKELAVSLVTSQLDADRMDYLLRDAYFTGVNYGMFDLDRILRMLRPYKGHIVVKESGMHAVEHYLMSRYQMYWQVYFHPVTRSAEILLHKIFERAKSLFEEGYTFAFFIEAIKSLFEGNPGLHDYLKVDEALMQTAFMQWTEERDGVLSDLCSRFLHRRLFKYVPLETIDAPLLERIRSSLEAAGFDPDFYMEIDFPTDLPYDIYRPGGGEEKLPILLLGDKGQITEISRKSEIVRSISGIRLGRHHLYFPEELLQWKALPQDIRQFLERRS